MAQVRAQRCMVPGRHLLCGEGTCPAREHARDEPARKASGRAGGVCALDVCAEQALRQPERAQDPVRAAPASTEEAFPVEPFGARLEPCGHVAEPERTPSPVAQKVEAEEPQPILFAEHAHTRFAYT